MASHEELLGEMPKLEKLSNAARLKHAKKRRQKQLKKWQEWLRMERATNGTSQRRMCQPQIGFQQEAVLNDLVARNDIIGVEKILQEGCNPNCSNADGLTLLHKCCIDNTVELAEMLLEHGADLNARDVEGWTPLHAAAATGNLAMVNMLIDEGASLVAINHDDKMPIDVSADSDIKYILQQRMLEAGYTDDVLEYIRVSVPKTMLADLKDSVKNGRSLNIQDRYGATALHVAAANGYTEVLEFLLRQSDLDLDIQDSEGWTPFHAAVCWGQTEGMKMLAEKGANMDIKNIHGETAYAIAEEADIRQYVLELKGQFGKTEEVEIEKEEEMGRRPRRMSVKRTSKQEKEEMAKHAVKYEAMMRRQSLAQQDAERDVSHSQDKTVMKEVSNEISLDEDEGTAVLLSITNKSETDTSTNDTSKNNSSKNNLENSITKKLERPEALEIDESAFKRPQKSVLKKTPASPAVSYTSSSPSFSPADDGDRKRSNGRDCCIVM